MSTRTQPQRIAEALDLTKAVPRAPMEKLGQYVLLARTIDKARSTFAGRAGEYHWDCPLGKMFFEFKGIDSKAFGETVASGASDAEILSWVEANGKKRTEDEINAWTYTVRTWGPETDAQKAFYEETRQLAAPGKLYIRTWLELLDAEEGRY